MKINKNLKFIMNVAGMTGGAYLGYHLYPTNIAIMFIGALLAGFGVWAAAMLAEL